MQVFKTCFKVIRGNLVSIMIYFLVFILLVVMLTMFYRPVTETLFQPVRIRFALIQADHHPFSDGLADYLADQAVRVDLPDDRERLQDALFYRDITYILRIPAGFGDSFMQGRYDLQLERTILPDSYSSIQMDLLVERFVNLAALYVDSLDLITVDTLLEAVRTDLAQEADVTLRVIEQHEIGRSGYYFIYLAYAMMAIMVLAVTSLMIVFNKQDLRRRNLSAPLKLSHFNLQLIFGGIVFALIVWLVMSLLSLAVGGATLRPAERAFLWLNALVFTFACMSISFLIGQFVRSRNVQPAIANVLALGTSFISGVFVPQSMLGKPVHTLASFTPTYWYVRAINEISALSTITAESLRPVAGYLLIQVGFIAAFLTVAMVIAKQRQQTAS